MIGRTPPASTPSICGATKRRNQLGIGAEGPVADDVVRAGRRNIQDGHAIDRDAERLEVRGQQPAVQAAGLDAELEIPPGELAEPDARRGLAPVRRLQPGDAAAFLIDEYGRVLAADGGAQLADERADLIGISDITGEQDEAERIRFLEESRFRRRER